MTTPCHNGSRDSFGHLAGIAHTELGSKSAVARRAAGRDVAQHGPDADFVRPAAQVERNSGIGLRLLDHVMDPTEDIDQAVLVRNDAGFRETRAPRVHPWLHAGRQIQKQ
jgi:hypothetical protein